MMMLQLAAAAFVAVAWAGQVMGDAHSLCKKTTLDFVLLEGDATHAAIEDDVRGALAKVGITLNARKLAKDAKNKAMVEGNFDLVFSETWGAPYDPHSYVSSWTAPDEAHYAVMKTLKAPLDPVSFKVSVDGILSEVDETKRASSWSKLLSDIHGEKIHVPLYGKRIPSVTRVARLSGYKPGYQQFDYPIHKIKFAGENTSSSFGPARRILTVAPGAQGGLFTTVGRLDPHSYRPNEFFSSNWVYEGLLAYGDNGKIEPALATKWDSTADAKGVETVKFTLRTGVKFHDGAVFNCAAVKLNFDHVFAPPLRTGDWHGWYSLPNALAGWSCEGETFVLKASKPYYPLLQELTYIRPLRMLSPDAFAAGPTSSPYTHNSCPTGWGKAELANHTTVICAGTKAIAGTGPFKFVSRKANATNANSDDKVIFAANAHYWNGKPDMDELHIVRYDTAADVAAALKTGTLDAVLGAGVLAPADLTAFKSNSDFEVLYSEPTMNTVLIMNIADKNLRETIIHAIDKKAIIDKELGGIEAPVSQLFPMSAPYCGKELTPKFDFDLKKAQQLNNCVGNATATQGPSTTGSTTPVSGSSAVASAACATAAGVVFANLA